MPSLPLLSKNMAASAAQVVLKTIKPHVPLIKFPQRLPVSKSSKDAEKSSTHDSVKSNKKKTTVIDSSQLPLKYRRKPLTKEEIEIIEKGGLV